MSFKIIPPDLNPADSQNLSGKQVQPVKPAEQKHRGDSFTKSEPAKVDIYNNLGKMQEVRKNEGTLLDSFISMRETVNSQLNVLLDSFSQTEGSSSLTEKTKDELSIYFDENPEALEQVASGDIPEYWNVENTAGRMFEIVMAGVTDETDRENFYTKAVDFVNRAYDEVKEMIGFEFPSLVQQTKEALLNGLEQYKGGTNIQSITFG